jgi:hypothetical protein
MLPKVSPDLLKGLTDTTAIDESLRQVAGHQRFTPIGAIWRVEHAFAQLERWRRLSRCY